MTGWSQMPLKLYFRLWKNNLPPRLWHMQIIKCGTNLTTENCIQAVPLPVPKNTNYSVIVDPPVPDFTAQSACVKLAAGRLMINIVVGFRKTGE